MELSEFTRRNIIDALQLELVEWWGRLDEVAFLSRLFDLSALPSTDHRFPDASGDIRQHRINNLDWESDWLFHDDRFDLLFSADDVFLRFICETIHPIVRGDATEVERLLSLYNSFLDADGFQLVEKTRISGRPVFIGRHVGVLAAPGVEVARAALTSGDASYVAQQITRMEAAVQNDPGLAIGTAKELVETCCRTILAERCVEIPTGGNLAQIVKLTTRELELTPADIPDRAKASSTIKRLLSNLATITQGMAELRNRYGTGHGRAATSKGLNSRHAKLAVGAASTLAVFLVETHQVRRDPEEVSPTGAAQH